MLEKARHARPGTSLPAVSRRFVSPGALAVASLFGLAAVIGVASIDPDIGREQALANAVPVSAPVVLRALNVGTDDLAFASTEAVRRGDSVYSSLARLGVVDPDAIQLIRTHRDLQGLRQFASGGQLSVRHDDGGGLLSLTYLAPDFRVTRVHRDDDSDEFSVTTEKVKPELAHAVRAGDVGRSLFNSMRSLGIPDEVQRQLVSIFAKQFDLHQAAKEIERVAVVFEEFSVDGFTLKTGRVLATELVRSGKAYRAVWFSAGKGGGKYYTPEGFSLDKTFLTSPVEYTQITSFFGQARNFSWSNGNPHRGIDYAAPIGTPVKAAGDGVVEFIGDQRGYGNMVVLKHKDPYTTLYAHLDAFADGVAKGARVRQGEVIGFVGKTGWATGPHLHYEFRKGDEPQDPMVEDIPADELDSKSVKSRFQKDTELLAAMLDRISAVRIARQ